MTKIFALMTTYWQYFSPSLWLWKNQSNDKLGVIGLYIKTVFCQ